MRWIGILISCSAAGSAAATYFEDDAWSLEASSILQTRRLQYTSHLTPRSSRIQRRGNCLARPCPSEQKKRPSLQLTKAEALIHGPGSVQNKIADSSFKMKNIPPGQSQTVRSSHPTYAYVGAKAESIEGHELPVGPDPAHPLQVNSRGRRVQALIAVPEGGSGRVKLKGDKGIKEFHVSEGTMGGGVASSSRQGGAYAYGEVTRGGEAHVWSLARRLSNERT